ncbi:hypothetical protein PsAD2_00241 [Pseudovibrio axinellae]|uniref:Uncharacterized protein n=1 Tax=Pseudovibrio axinellae TaxID=989403 RepID=A0A166B1J9_9HYPH|nr:hypothetical protein [Pseudovibrio axinellae]KZL21815.1 hypothetical protein PsAD2_00241 [Pseudovibrio axinellae]SEQ79582.1 hypothetical protein SAMN05421798_104235 [Pseudovibrio axinellae]
MGAALSFLIGTKAGRAVAAVLLLLVLAVIAYHQIKQGAFIEAEHEALQGTVNAERERTQDDAYLQGLEDYNLCLEYLRNSGMQHTECEQLRGVHKE